MSSLIINFRPEGDHEWTKNSACATFPIPNMFPAEGDHKGIAAAKSVCGGCPVRAQCLATALDDGEPHGVWGGLSAEERVAVRRNNSRRARMDGVPPLTGNELAADILDEEAIRIDARNARAAEAERLADNQQAAEDFGAMLDAAAEHVAQYQSTEMVSA